LRPVFLVDHPLELGRDFETAFVVDASWVIAAKHMFVFAGEGVRYF
jgi:hypothetical protein